MGLFCFAFKVNYGPGRDKSPAHICPVSLENTSLAIFMKMALHHFIKTLQATETQVTDLGDACLLNIYSVRPFNRLHLAPTLLDPASCGAPQRRRPSKHPRHLLRPHPRTQGHFKERARGARAHGAGVGGWVEDSQMFFPDLFLKSPTCLYYIW